MTHPTTQHYAAVADLAERYGVGPATIWRWARDPKNAFPRPIRLGANCTRWRLADVHSWEQAQREAS